MAAATALTPIRPVRGAEISRLTRLSEGRRHPGPPLLHVRQPQNAQTAESTARATRGASLTWKASTRQPLRPASASTIC